MGPDGAWRRVVRKDGYGYVFIPGGCFLEYGPHYPVVQVFNGQDLQPWVSVMPGFVAGLKMQEYEVLRSEGLDCGFCLAFIVCVI